jgi:hypothetical protein
VRSFVIGMVHSTRRFRSNFIDRNKTIGGEVEIDAWLGFSFPGRKGKYSEMEWHWEHFTGTDWDEESKKKQIYRILGDNKYWASSVDKEKGNFDYLMYADIDHNHPEVRDAESVVNRRSKTTSRNGPYGSPTNFNSVVSASTPSSTFPKISSLIW